MLTANSIEYSNFVRCLSGVALRDLGEVSLWEGVSIHNKEKIIQSGYLEYSQREANLEMQVENARFQRNAPGVLVLRHVPGCNDPRS